MFKKPIKIGAQNQLSGKDRKTIRNKLVELFDENSVEKILTVNDKIVSCKTSGSKMVIYNGNDYPLFVDGTGKNDYFPSLYTAIAYEPLLKFLEINEGVESYIFNGANLMWPGVSNYTSLLNFEKDQVVGIKTKKGELIAIGAMGCSLKELENGGDKSGVSVYVLHYLGDKLWELGGKAKPEVVVALEKETVEEKKEEKIEEKVEDEKDKKVEEKVEVKEDKKKKEGGKDKKNKKQKDESSEEEVKKEKSEEEKEEESDNEDDFASFVHTKKQTKQPIKMEKKGNQKIFSDDEDNDKKAKKKPVPKKEQKKKPNKKESESEEENSETEKKEEKQEEQQKSVVSSKLMDQQFKESFFNALKLSKVENELPIDSGRFFIDFMLLARPPGVKLEIKDTSYKKLGKFYEEMAKHKFIEFKHSKDKKGQQNSTIAKILWDNEELKNYEPTILRMNEKDVEEKEEVSDSKKKLKLTQTLVIENVYKLHNNFRNAIIAKKVNYAPTEEEEEQMKKEEEENKKIPEFYSEPQARALIERYINDKVAPKKDKEEKKVEKAEKTEKADKMVVIDYKNNTYLAELLKKEIEEYLENLEGNKEVNSGSEDEAKKKKGKKENIMRMDRGALVNRILRTFSVSYQMRDNETGFEAFGEGTFKGIQLIAEKSNNKNITKIIGLETFIVPKTEVDDQINGFANFLKEKFACSVNIGHLPGKNAGKEIVAHGNFINELEDLFKEEYKIKEDYISTQNKLDKKKKR